MAFSKRQKEYLALACSNAKMRMYGLAEGDKGRLKAETLTSARLSGPIAKAMADLTGLGADAMGLAAGRVTSKAAIVAGYLAHAALKKTAGSLAAECSLAVAALLDGREDADGALARWLSKGAKRRPEWALGFLEARTPFVGRFWLALADRPTARKVALLGWWAMRPGPLPAFAERLLAEEAERAKEAARRLVTQSTILSRPGWTQKAMALFRPPVFKKVPNPHYRSGDPMKLFDLGAIEAIEATTEFRAWADGAIKRSGAAKKGAAKGVATKTRRLLDEVRAMDVRVAQVKNVEGRASDFYNDWHEERGDYGHAADEFSDRGFLDRTTVNYIRHELTEYDEALWGTANRVGKGAAYIEINRKVYRAIAEGYPAYAGECASQFGAKAFGMALWPDGAMPSAAQRR